MTQAHIHPLEELRDMLVRSIGDGTGYQHESWAPKLALIDTLYPLQNNARIDYVPLGWLEQHREAVEAMVGSTLEQARGEITYDLIYRALHGEDHWAAAPILAQQVSDWQKTDYPLFFATSNYSATGEGNRNTFLAQRAATEADFLLKITIKVGGYFALGYDIYSEFPEDDSIAKLLVTPKLRNYITKAAADQGHVDVFLETYVNFS